MNFSKLNLRTPAQAKANLANLLGVKLELSLCSFMTTKGMRQVTVNGCYGSKAALNSVLRSVAPQTPPLPRRWDYLKIKNRRNDYLLLFDHRG